MTPSVTDSAIFTALRSFLLAILPAGTEVVQGQVNRVAEPQVADFIVITPLRRIRLATNVDTAADVLYLGSIAGTVMTVSDIELGEVVPGAPVFGVGVTANTTITAQISGPAGGAGTYRVTPAQTVTSRTLSSGVKTAAQATEIDIQMDFHGPTSADNAQVATTLLRDAYASEYFAANSPGIAPLFCNDPRQAPFQNDQQQYENRWIVEAMLEASPVVSLPQQYADSVSVDIISVDAVYPPQ